MKRETTASVTYCDGVQNSCKLCQYSSSELKQARVHLLSFHLQLNIWRCEQCGKGRTTLSNRIKSWIQFKPEQSSFTFLLNINKISRFLRRYRNFSFLFNFWQNIGENLSLTYRIVWSWPRKELKLEPEIKRHLQEEHNTEFEGKPFQLQISASVPKYFAHLER